MEEEKIHNSIPKVYSYVLTYDNGAAPNPFGGYCTLAICKPDIRLRANIGDWIIGTGSKRVKLSDQQIYDYSNRLVYAMRVTKKLTFPEYDKYCKKFLRNKIPRWNSKDWREKVGDCLFEYQDDISYKIRLGVHREKEQDLIDRDLRGKFVLLSNHFYYFGEQAIEIPIALHRLVKKGPNYKLIENHDLYYKFLDMIKKYPINTLSGEPQRKWLFEGTNNNYCSTYSDEIPKIIIDDVKEKQC